MKLEDFIDQMMDAFKVPETLEEAIAYINSDQSMQALIEEMAFRQVIINVLIAAHIVTEKDLNDSVSHFKKIFTESFAEELINKIDDFNKHYEALSEEQIEDPEQDIDDWEPTSKKIYDA